MRLTRRTVGSDRTLENERAGDDHEGLSDTPFLDGQRVRHRGVNNLGEKHHRTDRSCKEAYHNDTQ